MNEEAGLTGWILAAIGTVVSTLAGLVAMFYKAQINDYKASKTGLEAKVAQLEARADKCEDDREDLRVQVGRMEEKQRYLEQRVNELDHTKKNRDSIG